MAAPDGGDGEGLNLNGNPRAGRGRIPRVGVILTRTAAGVGGLNQVVPNRNRSAIMKKSRSNRSTPISRQEMIGLLNQDLAREYQAIIAYTVYSQTMKGAKYLHIAQELEKHAAEELAHAIQIAKQIDYLNGTPTVVAKAVKLSDKPEEMLHFDLENERTTILNYRERIRQAEAMGEFGLSEALRRIIAQEQEHLTDLADALGIDNPALKD